MHSSLTHVLGPLLASEVHARQSSASAFKDCCLSSHSKVRNALTTVVWMSSHTVTDGVGQHGKLPNNWSFDSDSCPVLVAPDVWSDAVEPTLQSGKHGLHVQLRCRDWPG
ncbi:TPA: hypothetical protein ACH3X1_015363 [Trebouxia sp. C0004]